MQQCIRVEVRVEGVVQGVGFRPYVHGLAHRLGLSGRVGNDTAGVFMEVEGAEQAVTEFLAALPLGAPPLAVIEQVHTNPLTPTGESGFHIVSSNATGRRNTLISADIATCADCLRELADPTDRRFGYPFINCTNCGPRFTIVRDVPYDRPFTTMAPFAMCSACASEYHDPTDRRFHAQPVCCPACGPRLRLLDAGGAELPGEPLAAAAALLTGGAVLAVKGLGGFHVAALASDAAATALLRARKHREDKPFAVMVADLDTAHQLCVIDPVGEQVLTGRRRPVVLLPRRSDAPVAQAVSPGNRSLGLMLPYTPLHHLLMREVAGPIVLTSGNVSDEPIAYQDDDARQRLTGISDAYLTHDRAIHMRTDDSVVRVFRGAELPVRRSRGYAPEPLTLAQPVPRPILSCGAELKSTFCLARGRHAFMSHHIGDLENYETLRSFTEGVAHFRRLFDVTPEVVAYDLHPEYLSTKYALELDDLELVGVQHHHAHIASCLADNGAIGPVLGVAFDGTGYGSDGTLWGGEFLLADLTGFQRMAHLVPVPLPGGAAAIRQPWRMAAAYLGDDAPHELIQRNAQHWDAVRAMVSRQVNAPLTSSAGRLFDAVAAVLGIRDAINYEGQAAIELEQRADLTEHGTYPAAVTEGPALQLHGVDLVRAAANDLRAGVAPAVIATRFHHGVADAIVRVCLMLRDSTGVSVAALSGGVFQNVLLLERTVAGLEESGFRVLTHSRVPPNDAGISLGQVAVAAASLRSAD
ncbi:MAG: hydrogenase maturation protein HypF [Pseudonocardiales bacterium]|nr:hydrogenase maturation protein HypF [Pseudonocardiales bacterium]